jgi:hypothetical protein
MKQDMDDRDKALHDFLSDLNKLELVHVVHRGEPFAITLTSGPHAAVQSDESDEVTDELLEDSLAFLDACRQRDQDAISATAKTLEGAIDLQVTTGFLTEQDARTLIAQLHDVADSSKWVSAGPDVSSEHS